MVIWVWRRVLGAEAEAEAEAGAEAEAEADPSPEAALRRRPEARGRAVKPPVAPGGYSVLPSNRVLYFFFPLGYLGQSPRQSPLSSSPPRPRGPLARAAPSPPSPINSDFYKRQFQFNSNGVSMPFYSHF